MPLRLVAFPVGDQNTTCRLNTQTSCWAGFRAIPWVVGIDPAGEQEPLLGGLLLDLLGDLLFETRIDVNNVPTLGHAEPL